MQILLLQLKAKLVDSAILSLILGMEEEVGYVQNPHNPRFIHVI